MTNAQFPMDPTGVLATLETELARGQRLRALAMLLSALVVTGPLVSLWATEPSLPLRTHLAFGGLVAIGVAWIGLGGYLLAVRRPLYAVDRVLATGVLLGAAAALHVQARRRRRALVRRRRQLEAAIAGQTGSSSSPS